jgi:hypothetical protein
MIPNLSQTDCLGHGCACCSLCSGAAQGWCLSYVWAADSRICLGLWRAERSLARGVRQAPLSIGKIVSCWLP